MAIVLSAFLVILMFRVFHCNTYYDIRFVHLKAFMVKY